MENLLKSFVEFKAMTSTTDENTLPSSCEFAEWMSTRPKAVRGLVKEGRWWAVAWLAERGSPLYPPPTLKKKKKRKNKEEGAEGKSQWHFRLRPPIMPLPCLPFPSLFHFYLITLLPFLITTSILSSSDTTSLPLFVLYTSTFPAYI